jgi:undecaprenyl-diphosphatase
VTLVPWLLGWRYLELDDELRKAFEVALHAGTAVGLLITLRNELSAAVRELDRHRASTILVSSLPPALAGYLLGGAIERRLGTPGSTAAGLLAGSLAMVFGDRAPQRRRHEEADALDGLWLGLAQASALVPGVSRGGATLAAARWRGFTRQDANRLSRDVGLPVIAGAALRMTLRLARRGLPPGTGAAFAAGGGAAFASALACTRLIRRAEGGRSLLPYALYRSLLAALVLTRLRSGRSRTMKP